jgi:hypothetical protein
MLTVAKDFRTGLRRFAAGRVLTPSDISELNIDALEAAGFIVSNRPKPTPAAAPVDKGHKPAFKTSPKTA